MKLLFTTFCHVMGHSKSLMASEGNSQTSGCESFRLHYLCTAEEQTGAGSSLDNYLMPCPTDVSEYWVANFLVTGFPDIPVGRGHETRLRPCLTLSH